MRKQIEVSLEPEVDHESLHLRNLKVIFSILRYPRDHWVKDKDLISERIGQNLQHLPEFLAEKYLPSDFKEVRKLVNL